MELSSNLAFSDQIDIFFGYLNNQDSLTLFFQQHGPVRQGLGAIVMSYALSLANWNFSIISYITVAVMILSAYFLLLSIRSHQISWITKIASISIVLSLGAGELMTVTPNISHSSLPVLFSFIIIYSIIENKFISKTNHIVIIICVILSLFTGFGIFVFFAYLIVFSMMMLNRFLFGTENLRKLAINYAGICIIMAISVSIFFMNYSITTAKGCADSAIYNIWSILVYSFNVTSVVYGGSKLGALSTPIGFFQIVLFAIISIVCTFRIIKNGDVFAACVLLLMLVSMAFIFNIAVGRYCLGDGSAFASRYYPLSSLGVIGMLLAIDRYFQNSFTLIIKVLSTCIVILNLSVVFPVGMDLMQSFYSHKNNFIQCMKKPDSLKFCNERYIIYPPSVDRLQFFFNMVQSTKRNQ